MNEQNLRPPYTSSEAREYGKKGGKASAESRRRKKTVRESMDYILNQQVTDPKQLAAIERAGLPIGDEPTYKDFIVASIALRAVQKGRMEDLIRLQEILGEARDETNSESLNKAIDILGGVPSVIDEQAD